MRNRENMIAGLVPGALRIRDYVESELGDSYNIVRMCNTGVNLAEYIDNHIHATMTLVPLLYAINVKEGTAPPLPPGVSVQSVLDSVGEYTKRANEINEWMELFFGSTHTVH